MKDFFGKKSKGNQDPKRGKKYQNFLGYFPYQKVQLSYLRTQGLVGKSDNQCEGYRRVDRDLFS